MTTRSTATDWERGYLAAVRRFPHAEFTIRRLISHSETFRDICEELAEAETALLKVVETPPEIREARRREWQEIVDRLVAEVAASLRNATDEQTGRGEHTQNGIGGG